MKRRYFFSGLAEKFTLLFATVALPPKVIESQHTWLGDLKSKSPRRARVLERLDSRPIPHGGLVLQGSKLLILDANGKQLREFDLHSKQGSPSRPIPKESADKLFWPPSPLGNFSLAGPLLRYMNGIWSVDLGRTPQGFERFQSNGSLVGWSLYPPELYFLHSNLKTPNKIRWTDESEPIRSFFCDRWTQVLAENLSNGYTRLFFFQEGRPQSYTILDFSSQNQGRSDASAIVSRSCNEFYVGGTFGLMRILY